MVPISFMATWPHYVDHLAPVWHALTPAERGSFLAVGPETWNRAVAHGIEPAGARQPLQGRLWPKPLRHTPDVRSTQLDGVQPLWCVAGAIDLRRLGSRRRFVFLEHGTGQQYDHSELGGFSQHYAGGSGRGKVELFLCPNELVAAANRAVYPDTPSVVIGAPKLDRWASPALEVARARTFDGAERGRETVGVTWHFDPANGVGRAVPETRWAFPEYSRAVADLALVKDVIGTAHPRAWRPAHAWYRACQIEAVQHLDDLWPLVDLLVADNTSAMWEAAALGYPVVVLNASWYRRQVSHGLRFWSHADVGLNVDDPSQLAWAVERTFDEDPCADRRTEIAHELYGELDGLASLRAAEALRFVAAEPMVS